MGVKPTLDIGERFRFGMHVVYMSHDEPNYVRLQQHAEKPNAHSQFGELAHGRARSIHRAQWGSGNSLLV